MLGSRERLQIRSEDVQLRLSLPRKVHNYTKEVIWEVAETSFLIHFNVLRKMGSTTSSHPMNTEEEMAQV